MFLTEPLAFATDLEPGVVDQQMPRLPAGEPRDQNRQAAGRVCSATTMMSGARQLG